MKYAEIPRGPNAIGTMLDRTATLTLDKLRYWTRSHVFAVAARSGMLDFSEDVKGFTE
jgi:hypothetical protein